MGSRILLFVLFVAWGLSASADATNGTSRTEQAAANLAALELVARDVTNETDRLVWNRRIELARKEVDHARRLTELERREKEIAAARQSRNDSVQQLREQLRAVHSDAASLAPAIAAVDQELAGTRQKRAEKIRQLADIADGENAEQKRADLRQEIESLDALAAVLNFRRDAHHYGTRLAGIAKRIDDALKAEELSTAPSIREILDQRNALVQATKSAESLALQEQRMREQAAGAAETLAIEQERRSHLDEEIATLNELYKASRTSIFAFKKTDTQSLDRQQSVATMLATARSQKATIDERITLRKSLVEAVGQCLAPIQQARALCDAEKRHLEGRIADLTQRFTRRIAVPVGIVLALFALDFLIGRLLYPLFFRRESLLISRRITSYLTLLAALLVLILSFLEDLKSIATLLGLVGAAIVIALQDLCSAFAGWFVIVAGRKVRVGDRVEIDGTKGDIVDIQMLRTTLMEVNNWLGVDEHTGRVLTIPNSFIFKSQVFNSTRLHPFVWDRLDTMLTYESPFPEAQALMQRILEEETRDQFAAARKAEHDAQSRHGLPETDYTPKLHTVLADSGVTFSMLFVAHYKNLADTKTRLARRIMAEFARDPRMQLAYPTQREITTPEVPPVPAAWAQ